MGGRLSALQRRVLDALSGFVPPFTLTGGSALIGFYLSHRSTRDLDLIWRRRERLERIAGDVRSRLHSAGLDVADLQASPTFHRFRVSDGREVTLVDLVAEPMEAIQPPRRFGEPSHEILVDGPHEILVNKLVALLGRLELRDLQDVQALVDAGYDLDQALSDAPRKDGGFSPPSLAWLLESFPVASLARAVGWSAPAIEELERFKDELIRRLLAQNR